MMKSNISRLAEFPRILLWSAEDYDSDDALQCIEFHENCAFPLFWLRPDALKSAEDKVRPNIGHFTILDVENGVISRWNDDKGDEPDEPKRGFKPNKVAWLWHDKPPACLGRSSNFIDEFVHLLRRPDIMFAADAWAMRKMGSESWNKLSEYLSSIKLASWLDDVRPS